MNKSLLYVNNTDPEDGGGGDRRLFDEAATLVDAGADVLVVASRTDPELAQQRVSKGVQIRTVKCVPDAAQRFPTLHFYLARSLFPLVSLPILISILYRNEFDVIVDSYTPHPSLVLLPGQLFSVPVVALVHEYHDRSALSKYPLPVGLIQLLVQNFLRTGLYSGVVVPREQTRQEFKEYGVQAPVYVVPNGIDIQSYQEPPDSQEVEAFDFVVVSRLVHRKGIDRLLEAMAIVVADRPNARLGIAGSGPKRDELEEQAARLGLESNVEFLGFISEARKRALLHGASVFVLSSRQEGFGIAVLEAMATGTPIVANDLAILTELVPEETNRLVDASDREEFATAMVEMLDTGTELRLAYGNENRQQAEQYSLDSVGQQAQAVYDKVGAHA